MIIYNIKLLNSIPVLNGEHLSYVSRESALVSSEDNFPVGVGDLSLVSGESFDFKFIPVNGAIGFILGRPYGLGKCANPNC